MLMVRDVVLTLKESRQTVFIGCRDNVLWLECCDNGLILGYVENLPVAYLAKGFLGGFKEQKALQEGCGERRDQRERGPEHSGSHWVLFCI